MVRHRRCTHEIITSSYLPPVLQQQQIRLLRLWLCEVEASLVPRGMSPTPTHVLLLLLLFLRVLLPRRLLLLRQSVLLLLVYHQRAATGVLLRWLPARAAGEHGM